MLVLRHPPSPRVRPAALTIGNFDGVHLGHRAMIGRVVEAARERELASCVLTFEPHPREFFSPDRAPARLSSLREKLELFAALGLDQVVVCRFDRDFARIEAREFIERTLVHGLAARWVLVGEDFRFGARRSGDFAQLAAAGPDFGFEVACMPTVCLEGGRVSSTAVRDRLAAGDLDAACRMLGGPYSVSGRVVRGDRLGMELGFPTANVRLRHNRPPLMGIFVVEVLGLRAEPLSGVASLGVRPTVKTDGVPVLEVHLFDFAREIYGKRLQVRFLHKLRDEQKYRDLDALKSAIAQDVVNARQFFRHRSDRQSERAS